MMSEIGNGALEKERTLAICFIWNASSFIAIFKWSGKYAYTHKLHNQISLDLILQKNHYSMHTIAQHIHTRTHTHTYGIT